MDSTNAQSDDMPADASSAGSAKAGPASAGILKSVQRRKRRRQVPPWALRTAARLHRLHKFLRYGVPHWVRAHRYELISYATSAVFMVVLVAAMTIWVLPAASRAAILSLVIRQGADVPEIPKADEVPEIDPPDVQQDLEVDSTASDMAAKAEPQEPPRKVEVQPEPEPQEKTRESVPTDTEMETVFRQGRMGGRSATGRQLAVRKFGGTVESEQAVNSGLRWLKKLQSEEGSWSFSDVSEGAQAGIYQENKVGATSLALLCFLGAGHTHLAEGPYRDVIYNGLKFIGEEAILSQGTADLRGTYEGGNTGMYIHALATICVSEAHALEPRDKDLTKITQMAVAFIAEAQDPTTGGWRYKPRDSTSDTSVTGWQIMALQSAKAGRIRFSSKTLRLAREYLRSAQTDDQGAFYSYIPGRGRNSTMTAVALLCRMYMGWRRDNEALAEGVAFLAKQGPSRANMYHNYYAAQVLHHWGGELWDKWNVQLREQLITTQVTSGPSAGSWNVTDPHGNVAGQLYQTALSILTLEIYYRHLPLYRQIEKPDDY